MKNRINTQPITWIAAFLTFFTFIPVGLAHESKDDHNHKSRTVEIVIPGEDRFTPYSMTIHAGDIVQWTNTDSDDHTIVSDDNFTTTGHIGTDQLIVANGGIFKLRFTHPGVFVYYCRFHAQVDGKGQPVAPGPDGGIQDNKGNFGTPMTGIINVLPGRHDK